MSTVKLLKKIYLQSLRGQSFEEFIIESTEEMKLVQELTKEGLITQNPNGLTLTPEGRKQFKVVFTGGVYDLIHRGHIETLNEAKSLGDLLVVVIARDSTAKRWKRAPINHEEDRRAIVNELKPVDIALLGNKDDHMKTIEWIKPDIIAIGADQHYDIPKLHKQLEERGLGHIEVIRLKSDVEGLSTTSLINRILARYKLKEAEEIQELKHSEGKQS